MAVPSVIKKFIRQYIDSSEGEDQVADKSPVQSVNDNSGNVEIEEYSDDKASDAAPVQSVNGETGEIEVESKPTIVLQDSNNNRPKPEYWQWKEDNTGNFSYTDGGYMELSAGGNGNSSYTNVLKGDFVAQGYDEVTIEYNVTEWNDAPDSITFKVASNETIDSHEETSGTGSNTTTLDTSDGLGNLTFQIDLDVGFADDVNAIVVEIERVLVE